MGPTGVSAARWLLTLNQAYSLLWYSQPVACDINLVFTPAGRVMLICETEPSEQIHCSPPQTKKEHENWHVHPISSPALVNKGFEHFYITNISEV